MQRKNLVGLIAILCLAVGLAPARSRHKARAARKTVSTLASIPLKQSGDTIQAGKISLTKGYLKEDVFTGNPDGSGVWYCEIAGEDGKVAWSGFLANPLHGAAGTVQVPYKHEFKQARFYKTDASGPVPVPDRGKSIFSVDLP